MRNQLCLCKCITQVTDLRQKARLLVHDGATLMGVLDEFGVLEEGEVFLQVRTGLRKDGDIHIKTNAYGPKCLTSPNLT